MKENPNVPEDLKELKRILEENYLGISKDELASMAQMNVMNLKNIEVLYLTTSKIPTSVYAGNPTEEIIAMLRKEADGIGYADVLMAIDIPKSLNG